MFLSSTKHSIIITCMLLFSASSMAANNRTWIKRGEMSTNLGPAGDHHTYAVAPNDLLCRPFGLCEKCPPDERHQPFCQPYGNRRLVHCIPKHSPTSPDQDAYSDERDLSALEGQGAQGASGGMAGEVPAWEACGKVVAKEAADYWEFVIANSLLLALSLTVVLVRSNALAASQYRQLAARIGITRAV